MKVKIVSFCTEGAYQAEALPLCQSASRYKLDFNLVTYTKSFLPDWEQAVCYKPLFILQQIRLWDQHDWVVWTDADSEFIRQPDWLRIPQHADIAWYFFQRHPGQIHECLTGTMAFRPNRSTIEFVERWVELTESSRNSSTPEQRSLQKMWLEESKLGYPNIGNVFWRDARIGILPKEFVWIFDDFPAIYGEGCEPMILHRQASRRLRT